MKTCLKTTVMSLFLLLTLLCSLAIAKPYSNQVIINFDAPELAQAIYRKSQTKRIPTEIIDLDPPLEVATKEAALEFLSTAKPGKAVYWQSSRFADKYGYLKKSHFGPTTIAEALIIDKTSLNTYFERELSKLSSITQTSRIYITGRTLPAGDSLRADDGKSISDRELTEIISRFSPRLGIGSQPVKITLLVDSGAAGGTESFGAKLSHELWHRRIFHQLFARSGAISVGGDMERTAFLVDGQYKGENSKYLFQHLPDGSFFSEAVDYNEDPKAPVARTGASGGGASAAPTERQMRLLPHWRLPLLRPSAHSHSMSPLTEPTHLIASGTGPLVAAAGSSAGGAGACAAEHSSAAVTTIDSPHAAAHADRTSSPSFILAVNREAALASLPKIAPGGYIAHPTQEKPHEFVVIQRDPHESISIVSCFFITPELDMLDSRQIIVTDRSEALARFSELSPGSFFIWKSASVEGAYGIYGKGLDGLPFSKNPFLLD